MKGKTRSIFRNLSIFRYFETCRYFDISKLIIVSIYRKLVDLRFTSYAFHTIVDCCRASLQGAALPGQLCAHLLSESLTRVTKRYLLALGTTQISESLRVRRSLVLEYTLLPRCSLTVSIVRAAVHSSSFLEVMHINIQLYGTLHMYKARILSSYYGCRLLFFRGDLGILVYLVPGTRHMIAVYNALICCCVVYIFPSLVFPGCS